MKRERGREAIGYRLSAIGKGRRGRWSGHATRHWRLAPLLLLVAACEWFSDFKQQPKIDPWEVTTTDTGRTRGANDTTPSRGQPLMSVPMSGVMVPAFAVSYQPLPATIDSMAGLANPVPADARSLENGRMYYMINCAVCHGASGNGMGPVTTRGMPPISLITDVTKARTDGYLWGMIRNGRGLMPTYNRIEEMDRWDVVNFVRALQGLGPAPADTLWTVVPGETGTKIPGATRLGPTRPVPFTRPPAAAHPAAVDTGAAPAETKSAPPGRVH